jgi:hypothetical protein
VLRRIFGPRREVTRFEKATPWKVHNEHSLPSIIRTVMPRVDEMDTACSRNEEKRNAYRLLAVKLVGKRPLGRY